MKYKSHLLVLLIILLAINGCSFKKNFPINYYQINDNPLCLNGSILLLQVGNLQPADSVYIYINNKLIVPCITPKFPYPGYIDEENHGGHGETYYDFLLVRKHNSTLLVINMEDPKKMTLRRILIKNNIIIKAINQLGNNKVIDIPKDINHFLEIRFFVEGGNIYGDTLHHIQLFM